MWFQILALILFSTASAQIANLPHAIAFIDRGEPLSNQLNEEILSTEEFKQEINGKINLTTLDISTSKRNKALQRKYRIVSTPVIVLLDDDNEFIGMTGYRRESGAAFGKHLLNLLSTYKQYEKERKAALTGNLSGKEIKRLYQKAHELNHEKDALAFVEVGINSDQSHFFMIEKYKYLAEKGQMEFPEAKRLKKGVLEQDPDNRHLTKYHLALIEYEANCRDQSCKDKVAPLIAYLEEYQTAPYDHLWQLNLMVATELLKDGKEEQAKLFATEALKSAPRDRRDLVQGFLESNF